MHTRWKRWTQGWDEADTPEVELGHTPMADIKDRRALNEGLTSCLGLLAASNAPC